MLTASSVLTEHEQSLSVSFGNLSEEQPLPAFPKGESEGFLALASRWGDPTRFTCGNDDASI